MIQCAILLSEKWWFFELFSHYVWYLLPVTIIIFTCSIFMREVSISLLLGLTLFLQIAQIEPWQPLKKHTEDEPNFRIMSHNFLLLNNNFEQGIALIEKENPDLFIIHEASTDWEKHLSKIKGDYPHQHHSTRPGAWGFSMGSRVPVTFTDIVIGSQETIHARLNVEGKQLNIIAFHPMAPITSHFAMSRNKDLIELTKYVNTLEGHTIVAGDFNLTPWSPYFKKLTQEASLQKACGKLICGPTWAANIRWLNINIDHILISPEIEVSHFEISQESAGSDHLPVIANLVIR